MRRRFSSYLPARIPPTCARVGLLRWPGRLIISSIIVLAGTSDLLRAQVSGTGRAIAADTGTSIQFPNATVSSILLYYEQLTGAKVIRDASVQAATLSIETSGTLTREEAALFIEESLLLNGFAIVDTDRQGVKKVVSFSEKSLSSEGIPVIANPFQLPETEEVVTFLMPLQFISPDDAVETFTGIVDLHPYGKVVPLRSASAVVVTENTSTIRRMLELRDLIDIRPVRTESASFLLERADAEEVVEAITDILQLDDSESLSGPPGPEASADSDAIPSPRERIQRTLLPTGSRGAAFADPASPRPRIRAIPRTNGILVVATPMDLETIRDLIDHLDAPVEAERFMRRKLDYIPVSTFLPIARDALLRVTDLPEGEAEPVISGGEIAESRNSLGETAAGANPGFGGSPGIRGLEGNGSLTSFGAAGQDADIGPQSIVVDKTLLIADNAQNLLIASGPPEHLRTLNDLLDVMDSETEQIQISAVIAQLNLRNDFEFGLDFLRSLPSNGGGFDGAGSFRARDSSRPLVDVGGLTDVNNLIGAASRGFTAYGQINSAMDLFLSTLETTNRFKILSRPTVYTQNNRQAVIQTGQRVAVPRSTLSSLDVDGNNTNQVITANIDFENVLLRIEVVPLINSNGQITLRIKQSNDDIIGSQIIGGDEIPTIGTQALGTTVMVPDGGTVLLGGLISEEESKDEAGLPLFANLPLVGRVFGSTDSDVQRQELLIFIQPRVIRHTGLYPCVDRDMVRRADIGPMAESFADGVEDNRASFDSREYESPQKRLRLFRSMFRKSGSGAKTAPESETANRAPREARETEIVPSGRATPALRAVPVSP